MPTNHKQIINTYTVNKNSLVPRSLLFLPSVCIHNIREWKIGKKKLLFVGLPLSHIFVNANGR